MAGPRESPSPLRESETEPRTTPFPSQPPSLQNSIRKTIHIKNGFLQGSLYKHLPLFYLHPMEERRSCPSDVEWENAEKQNGKMKEVGRKGTQNEEQNQNASFLRGDLWAESVSRHAAQRTPETHNLSTFFLPLIAFLILTNSMTHTY